LLQFIEGTSQAGVGYGTGKENGSITFYGVRNNVKTSIFSVYSNGFLTLNLGSMPKIFSENEVVDFKNSLSTTPFFREVVKTDKYYYSVKLEVDVKTQEMLDQFKQVVVAFLKSVE